MLLFKQTVGLAKNLIKTPHSNISNFLSLSLQVYCVWRGHQALPRTLLRVPRAGDRSELSEDIRSALYCALCSTVLCCITPLHSQCGWAQLTGAAARRSPPIVTCVLVLTRTELTTQTAAVNNIHLCTASSQQQHQELDINMRSHGQHHNRSIILQMKWSLVFLTPDRGNLILTIVTSHLYS